MADPVVRHQRREVVYRILRTAGHIQSAHDVGDRAAKETGAVLVQLAHDIALRDQTDHPVLADHNHGADIADRQFGEQGGDRRRLGHRCHRRALVPQNVRDAHVSPPAPVVVMTIV